MTRIFLTIVAGTYLYLAIWCATAPEETAGLVGFELQPGSGQSEFLTVYGGLELGLGLYLLLPLLRKSHTASVLLCCMIIHGCLVAFRSAGFLLYAEMQAVTWKLAAGEWVIFLVSAALWFFHSRSIRNRESQMPDVRRPL